MPIDYGSNNVITSGNISSSGIVTATSGVFNGRLDINNDIKANGFRTIQLDRTVAGALNSYTDIGSIDMTNGAHNLSISIAASIGGYSVAKTYLLSGQYNSDPSWVIVAPLSDSGPYESQNFELLAQFSGSSCNLRIRKSSGSSGGGAYNVTILYTGYSSITWTPSTATGTDSTVYSVCNSALISQADGKVGIGTTSPSTTIHVSGSATGAGSMFRLQNTASSNNTYFDIKIGTPGNYDDYIFFARNGIDFFGAASNSTLYFPNDTRIASNKQIIADPNGNAFINLYNGSAQTDIGYISGNALRFLNSYSEIARFDSTGKLGLGTTTPSGQLHVIGSGIFASGVNITNQTASTIAGFDASKNVTSLSTATYPSLTELSYVKGVTSSLQTQIDGKSNTGHTHTTTDITNFNTAVSGLLGKTIAFFTPLDNQPPATNFATLDTRNSIAVLDFSDTTEESSVFVGVIPDKALLGSGIIARINWMATTATSGDCRWGVQFEKMDTDTDSDSFDSATEGQSTTNATAGIPTVTSITCTSIDSLAAGDFFRLKIYRDASDTINDTMTDDAELISVELRSIL